MPPDPLRTLPFLVAALLMGVLTFTGFATFIAFTRGGMAPPASTDYTLLLVLAVLGPSEFLAYHVALRPMFARRARETASASEETRDFGLAQQFAMKTIIAAALLEGWGLFGAVILFLIGQWPALAAPMIAAVGLALLLDARGRFERFKEDATGQRQV